MMNAVEKKRLFQELEGTAIAFAISVFLITITLFALIYNSNKAHEAGLLPITGTDVVATQQVKVNNSIPLGDWAD